MAETGGTTTQSGINYQNSIAALFLGRLIDPRQRTAGERVIEVRVEAPEHVDDIVIRHADGTRSFIQAKEALSLTSQDWSQLWNHFAEQSKACVGEQFRLILAMGSISSDIEHLRELCDRAKGKKNREEWSDSLSLGLKGVANKITDTFPQKTAEEVFELVRLVEVWIWPLNILERDMIPLWIPPSVSSPKTLFDLLRGKVGGKARIRGQFHAVQLLDELYAENKVKVNDVPGWGTDAYLQAIRTEMGTLAVPGTTLSGPIDDLFFWMPLHDRAKEKAHPDFEEEDPRWRWERLGETIDLRDFPRGLINRAVIDAGAGFGKTTLLHAIAYRLSSGVRIPVLIALDSLAVSNLTVLGYLNDKINNEYNVSIDWERLCEGGRVVVLLDGLDELSTADRTSVLNTIVKFASRFNKSAFLLTVRDSAALTVPFGVPVLALNRLDGLAIRQFAESYARHGGRLSADALSAHLRRHPDLRHLLRIPLFLALVLASVGPEDNLPRSRSELLEHYLLLLFSPERHKPKPLATRLAVLGDLREAAELLAWRGLENDGIGLAEKDAKRLLQGQGLKEQPDVYIERLVQDGVLRHAASRLHFAYPIIQEYLAASWLIANAPKEIGPSFASISRRPWAQALQFALEMHPDAGAIIKNQLDVSDDAFNTTLRLVARCIVNGAKVNPEIRKSVGEHLADAWPSESYSIRDSIGYLLADGFLDPLPQKAVKHISTWALHSGGAEIIAAKASPNFTREILKSILSRDISDIYYLHGWQIAVDDIADEALDLYLDRVRNSRTTEKELESLSSLIRTISPSRLSLTRWREIATDSTLPSIIRLSGYQLAPSPVPLTPWQVIDDVIKLSELDETNLFGYHAFEFFWRMQDGADRFVQMLNDPAIPEKRICSTLEGLLRSDIASDAKRAILRRAMSKSTPSQKIRFLMLLCLAIWGDEEAERESVSLLASQDFDDVTTWLYQANKFSEATVRNAANILSKRPIDPTQLLLLLGCADFGLSYKTEATGFNGVVGKEPYNHPARGEMLTKLLSNVDDEDESLDALKVRVRSGDNGSREKLIKKMRNIMASFHDFMPFDDDQKISSALYILGQQTDSLPLDFLFEVIDKSSSNAGQDAVDFIVRSGDQKVIVQLLERYNSRSKDFVRQAIFSGLETLGGRYGVRFIREGTKLIVE